VILPSCPADKDPWSERLKNHGIAVAYLPLTDFSGAPAQERLKKLFGAASLRGFWPRKQGARAPGRRRRPRYLENTQWGARVRPGALHL